MSIILPYDEKIGGKQGAFITPSGKILSVDSNHEDFAYDYCNSEEFKKDNSAFVRPGISPLKKLEDKALISSYEKLKYFLKWMEKKHIEKKAPYEDFLVLVMQYDKIETSIKSMITTTAVEPHVKFFNYYLMDWDVKTEDIFYFNEETKRFDKNPLRYRFASYNEIEAIEELDEIKSKVKVKDRKFFIKD